MKFFSALFFLLPFSLFSDTAIFLDSAGNHTQIDSLQYEEASLQHTTDTVLNKSNEKKIIAALAFPFPLGIIGAHRIYMGAKPYIPLVYIATLGGCLGILPLIDFIVIVSHKNIEPYRTDKVFMWLK